MVHKIFRHTPHKKLYVSLLFSFFSLSKAPAGLDSPPSSPKHSQTRQFWLLVVPEPPCRAQSNSLLSASTQRFTHAAAGYLLFKDSVSGACQRLKTHTTHNNKLPEEEVYSSVKSSSVMTSSSPSSKATDASSPSMSLISPA